FGKGDQEVLSVPAENPNEKPTVLFILKSYPQIPAHHFKDLCGSPCLTADDQLIVRAITDEKKEIVLSFTRSKPGGTFEIPRVLFAQDSKITVDGKAETVGRVEALRITPDGEMILVLRSMILQLTPAGFSRKKSKATPLGVLVKKIEAVAQMIQDL